VAVERVEGVREASFSYERSEGFVTYDPAVTSPEEFLAELAEMTDFRGTVREALVGGE
jgi:copper chaperone CopZ